MESPTKPIIRIDVISDVVCPWCYIGKRRLENALAAWQDRYDFNITYHPFELNPALPASGVEQRAFLINKFGGEARYEQLMQQVVAVAREEGLEFRFDIQKTLPNTRIAHALLLQAQAYGVQAKLKEALLKAYFTDGLNLADHAVLSSIAQQTGLPENVIQETLNSTESQNEVHKAELELQKLGISGVPFYIINNRFALSGAQPMETWIKVLDQATEQPKPGN
jgi:predicted DsbA family dithiol-disulfide isomerase